MLAPVFVSFTVREKVWNCGATLARAVCVTVTWLVTSTAVPQADPPWLNANVLSATVRVAVRGPPEFNVTV